MPLGRWERLKLNLLIGWFGFKEVPLIGHTGVRVLELDQDRCVIRIPLGRRTKNHLGSMYLGALAIGADAAGEIGRAHV